jgi:hypothetical protein
VNFFPLLKTLDWQAIWIANRSVVDSLVAQKTGVDNFPGQSKLLAIDG